MITSSIITLIFTRSK